MDAADLIAEARHRSGLSLRELAARADTSHSAIAAYERRRRSPTAATLDRILTAAGFAVDVTLRARMGAECGDRSARGRELADVLELASMFPARHDLESTYPRFGHAR